MARVHEAGCADVLVVVGAAATQVEPLARSTGAAVVVAADWDEGMGASLRAGLDALSSLSPPPTRALVTLVDLPDVTAEVVRRLLAAAPDSPTVLARAAYGGVPGHPVLLGRDHWPAVRDGAVGDRGARGHLSGTRHLLVECGDLATGRDLDTADDLEREQGRDSRG